MLRSMYAGISGMKNFQVKLDVIGNNIANVNTYGFKKGRTTFKDLVNQQISVATAATQFRGGTNSQQVGLGSQIASIDTIHTTGSTQTTSRTLDLALAGDGFFPVATVKDPGRVNVDRGNQIGDNRILGAIDDALDMNYTRAGNFYLDDKGYLVTSDGMFIVGESGEKSVPTDLAVTKSINALNAINNFNNPFKDMTDTLKGISTQAKNLMDAYNEYSDAQSNWEKNESPETDGPMYAAMESTHDALTTIWTQFNEKAVTDPASFDEELINFNSSLSTLNGAVDAFNTAEPVGQIFREITTSLLQLENTFPDDVTDIKERVSDLELSQMNDLLSNLDNYMLDLEKIGRTVIDFENLAEELQQPQWTNGLSGDAGLIQIPLTAKSFSIGPDGTVSFVNNQGELNIAGQIRIANFANAGGMEKVGGNLFRASANSGSLDRNNNGIQLDELLAPGSEGAASIVAGTLEMSNVDLSEEFTEMIVAQRGFQSNTKIITTSDEILQELVNLKR
ncbi:flagellar hook-basal body complex protein [Metabacillus herbersteinensis]|uniref:Flagellar hook protein FlgE n=1 Tax=Metabacillus herbersteinensis TaxID=283816 RepID=A0ABV6GCK6_9BACI